MIIKQIVNNNVIISQNDENEVIAVGKGIGFHGKVGQEVDDSLIEKTYVLQSEEKDSNIKLLLEEIPYEVVKFGIKAADYIAKCSTKKINKRILIPLTDHLYSCLERYKEGVVFNNPLAFNVNYLYKDEYKIAEDVLDMLNSDFNTDVGKDEAAFITLHIINAMMDIDIEDTYTATNIIDISINTIEESFDIKLENNDANFARFITHLQFFAKRMIKNTYIDEEIQEVNKHINILYKKEYECAKLIGKRIKEKYQCQIDENEYTYLTIHIARLLR